MRQVMVVSVAVLMLAASARAEDLWPVPPWGDATGFPETYQTWEFAPMLAGIDQGTPMESPTWPSVANNLFGEAYITWPDGPFTAPDPETQVPMEYTAFVTVDYVDYMPPLGNGPDDAIPDTPTVHIGVNGPDGLPASGVPVPVSIWIPNNPDPNLVKKVFWQMTSDKSPTPLGDPPTITGSDGTTGTSVPSGLPHIQHDASTWYTYNGMLELRPNPDGEWITFGLVDSTNIEEIVIKTVCMPEPATMGLLAVGGVLALIRRKR